MSHDAEVPDSLSRTIAAFREEVLGWIDTTLIRLRERQQEETMAKEQKPAPPPFTRVLMEPEAQPKSTGTGNGSVSQSPDSLKRLDALARLLDKRLKVTDQAPSISPPSSGDLGESGG
jgi:hypothetical protein